MIFKHQTQQEKKSALKKNDVHEMTPRKDFITNIIGLVSISASILKHYIVADL